MYSLAEPGRKSEAGEGEGGGEGVCMVYCRAQSECEVKSKGVRIL